MGRTPKSEAGGAAALTVPAYHILLALANGERHGYGIIKEVEESTAGSIRLLPGTLYRLLKEMSTDGWIVEVEGDDDDERRRYYRLTPRGRRIAIAESERFESLVRIARARRLLPSTRAV